MNINSVSNSSYIERDSQHYLLVGVSFTTTFVGAAFLYRLALQAKTNASYWGDKFKRIVIIGAQAKEHYEKIENRTFSSFFPHAIEKIEAIRLISTPPYSKQEKILAMVIAIGDLLFAFAKDIAAVTRKFFHFPSPAVQKLEQQLDEKSQKIANSVFKIALVPFFLFLSTALVINYRLISDR